MSFFESVERYPDDPIFGLLSLFAKDPRDHKVNLGIGVYKTSDGKPFVLPSVRKVESLLLSRNLNKEYLPIEGDVTFLKETHKLLFGEDASLLSENRIASAQTVGGTSALRSIAELLHENHCNTIFIPSPTWPNHKAIFSQSHLKVETYPYYDPLNTCFDFKGMCAAIKEMPKGIFILMNRRPPRSTLFPKEMPKGSAILLHGCCHNPTGFDPDRNEWQEIADLIKKSQIIPVFDLAYLGFSKGTEEDAFAIRHFLESSHELLIALSYSKNFGLYGERVGALVCVAQNEQIALNLQSLIKHHIRASYSTPPLQGMRIVSTILQSPSLREDWKIELRHMRERIQEMRKMLVSELLSKGCSKDFSFINKQSGLFSYCGLGQDSLLRLKNEYGIYIPLNGRINVAGLNAQNLPYVVEAILSVL